MQVEKTGTVPRKNGNGTPKKRERYPEKTGTLGKNKSALNTVGSRGTAILKKVRKVL